MKQPLSERVRPQQLEDIIGQKHLVGKDGVITRMVASKRLPSMILWGPPGVGKTTMAQILAKEMDRPFKTLSAISSGVKEVREVIQQAAHTYNTILFIDEIHRFNKSQQDALLGAVERGIITLIGATTENPSFEVNSALLSRCQVYTLKALTKEDCIDLIKQAIGKDTHLQKKQIELKETEALLNISGGDARKLLNLLDLIADSEGDEVMVTNDKVMQVAQQKTVIYDKSGESHYDIVSAFIKSIRGSDPNGAIYWLARMLEGGEDVKFIARRLIISASEDIGNANPTALVIANNCFTSVNTVGMPEARIILAQATTYLACSPKSNASYMAINEAMRLVKETGNLPVPMHLRNAPTKLMREQGYGKGYKYSHSYPGNFAPQEYLPNEISGTPFYNPGDNAREKHMREQLKQWWGNKYKY
ncbi:replication-associated recombination protein A [Limibacter armeniacum]|uniref:replication-associated recombination protein A n=1 Tax=Limibacter armeniacum TaxID=466084 RepID=UPI002FE5C0D9